MSPFLSLPHFLLCFFTPGLEASRRRWDLQGTGAVNPCCLLYVQLNHFVLPCHSSAPRTTLTRPITPAWTSQRHTNTISRRALADCAPSPVCCCWVGCLCRNENKKGLFVCFFLLVVVGGGVSFSLCSFFRFVHDHHPTSHSHAALPARRNSRNLSVILKNASFYYIVKVLVLILWTSLWVVFSCT